MSQRPAWVHILFSAAVGIAMGAFLAIAWPWDLAALAILLALAALVHRRDVARALLLYGFASASVLTAVGIYTNSTLPQVWIPPPALAGCGAIAVAFGAAWVTVTRRKGQAEAARKS